MCSNLKISRKTTIYYILSKSIKTWHEDMATTSPLIVSHVVGWPLGCGLLVEGFSTQPAATSPERPVQAVNDKDSFAQLLDAFLSGTAPKARRSTVPLALLSRRPTRPPCGWSQRVGRWTGRSPGVMNHKDLASLGSGKPRHGVI